jgi:hypothetical protein
MSEPPCQRGAYASQSDLRDEPWRDPEASGAPPTRSEDEIEPADAVGPLESDDGWVDA